MNSPFLHAKSLSVSCVPEYFLHSEKKFVKFLTGVFEKSEMTKDRRRLTCCTEQPWGLE